MTLRAEPRSCVNCDYFFKNPEGTEGGWCRRQPPKVKHFPVPASALKPGQVKIQAESSFPAVPEYWWCGEFEQKRNRDYGKEEN